MGILPLNTALDGSLMSNDILVPAVAALVIIINGFTFIDVFGGFAKILGIEVFRLGPRGGTEGGVGVARAASESKQMQ